MMGLTRIQADMLEAIRSRQVEGVGPSYEELREDLGLSSKSEVQRALRALRERGYVNWMPGRARSLSIKDTAAGLRSFSDAALLAEVERRGLR